MRSAVKLVLAAALAAGATSAVAGNAPTVLTQHPHASAIGEPGKYYLANLRSNQLYRRVAALIGADPNGTVNLTSPPFLLPDNVTRVQVVVAPDNRILEVLPAGRKVASN